MKCEYCEKQTVAGFCPDYNNDEHRVLRRPGQLARKAAREAATKNITAKVDEANERQKVLELCLAYLTNVNAVDPYELAKRVAAVLDEDWIYESAPAPAWKKIEG
jgi:hypothetical protein